MSADDLTSPALSRRNLLVTGGLTVSLGALVAACGGGEEAAPGRVGNAPVPTDLPTVIVDDAVLLRTATSLEFTALDVYRRITELGVLDGAAAALVERLVADHTADSAAMAELTTQTGGEPYECANAWYEERIVGPLFDRIAGNEDEAIEPSDDPARDAMTIAFALESTLGAMYQDVTEKLGDRALRPETAIAAARAVRHAAAIAIARDGAPGAYVSPTLWGDEIDPSASDGVVPIFAVGARFGSLAPVEFTLGPNSDAGTRFSATMETPADNAFVYADQTCDP